MTSSNQFFSVALVLVAFGLVGCGPRAFPELQSTTALQAATRCGQGPYEVSVAAYGNRWGEDIELQVYGDHPPNLQYAIEVDGEVVRQGAFEGFTMPQPYTNEEGNESIRYVAYEGPPMHDLCGRSDAEAALAAAPVVVMERPSAGGEVAVTPAPTVEVEASVDVDVPVVEADARTQLETVEWRSRTGREFFDAGIGHTHSVIAQWRNEDPNAPPPLAEGAPIRLRIWGNTANMMEGLVFVVRRYRITPNVPEEEYVAHLHEEEAERELEAAERERRAAERAARGPSRRQRRRARRARERAAEAQARREFCDAHHADEDCWGPGGYAAEMARREQARQEREAELAARIPAPDGPPPPPRPEAQPPKSSMHATWVPGYWHWVGRWVWIGGSWDVPEADLQAFATVQAPSAPPPPRAETPPPAPGPGLVWVAGYWQWDGQRFVWVDGRWQLPRAGATWVAPSWQVRGGGVVFMPGRWSVQVR